MKHYLYKKGEHTFSSIEPDVVTAVAAWIESLGVESDIKITTDVSSDYLKLKATAGAVSFTITAKDESLKITDLDGVEILDLDGSRGLLDKRKQD